MCGRFAAAIAPGRLVRFFDAIDWEQEQEDRWRPNYNVAPTQMVLVVRERGGQRTLDALRWGLVPPWADDLSIGTRMINARSETVTEKRSYSRPFATRRCLVPIDGFYEWQAPERSGPKQPHYVFRGDGEPLAVPGLWESWSGPGHDSVETFTLLTCAANRTVASIHHRMPVVLSRDRWATWLDPDEHDTDLLSSFLEPAADDLLVHHPVSRDVNSVANNRPDLREPVQLDPPLALF